MFSAACGLFCALGALFAHACFCFQPLTDSFAKAPGVWGSTWTRAQRRTRRQWAGAHAESRAERRWNIAQRIAATGAASFVAKCPGGIGTQPVASRFALRIDALDGEAGQKLHIVFPSAAGALLRRRPSGARPEFPDGRLLARILAQPCSAVKGKDRNMLGYRCRGPLAHSMPMAARKTKRDRA